MNYQFIYIKGVLVAKLPSGYPTINFLNNIIDDEDLRSNIEKLLNIDSFELSDITIEFNKK